MKVSCPSENCYKERVSRRSFNKQNLGACRHCYNTSGRCCSDHSTDYLSEFDDFELDDGLEQLLERMHDLFSMSD